MKKIIRYLAKTYGVEAEIRRQQTKENGYALLDLAWFMHHNKPMQESLRFISNKMIEYGHIGNSTENRLQIDEIFKQ